MEIIQLQNEKRKKLENESKELDFKLQTVDSNASEVYDALEANVNLGD